MFNCPGICFVVDVYLISIVILTLYAKKGGRWMSYVTHVGLGTIGEPEILVKEFLYGIS